MKAAEQRVMWQAKGILARWKPIEERFKDNIRIEGDCWIWFKVKPGTYGRIMVNGKKVKAHRYSYEKKYGPIPSGLHACHTCDNPRCVNPDHIFPGTDTDNVRDCVRKGRLRPHGCAVRTSCRKGHPYKEGSFVIDREGYRNCLVCRRAALQKGRA